MAETKRVLFLCTGNACRGQMADDMVNHDFAGKIEAASAGTEPQGLTKKLSFLGRLYRSHRSVGRGASTELPGPRRFLAAEKVFRQRVTG